MLTSAHPAAPSNGRLTVFGRTFQEYRTSRILSTPLALGLERDIPTGGGKRGGDLRAWGQKIAPKCPEQSSAVPVQPARDGRPNQRGTLKPNPEYTLPRPFCQPRVACVTAKPTEGRSLRRGRKNRAEPGRTRYRRGVQPGSGATVLKRRREVRTTNITGGSEDCQPRRSRPRHERAAGCTTGAAIRAPSVTIGPPQRRTGRDRKIESQDARTRRLKRSRQLHPAPRLSLRGGALEAGRRWVAGGAVPSTCSPGVQGHDDALDPRACVCPRSACVCPGRIARHGPARQDPHGRYSH